MKKKITWIHVTAATTTIADNIKRTSFKPQAIIGISRGGIIPATLIAYHFNAQIRITGQPFLSVKTFGPTLLVDDVSDTGKTLEEWKRNCLLIKELRTATLFIKPSTKFVPDFHYEEVPDNVWLKFPWEPSVRPLP